MTKLSKSAFVLAALGSLIAALLHVWIVVSGKPESYALFGAPPDVVASAADGTLYAPTITLFIAAVLLGWVMYALSAIGTLPRMFLLRTGLIAIAFVLLLRGLILVPAYLFAPDLIDSFAVWSSLICIALGVLFLIGLVTGWRSLAP